MEAPIPDEERPAWKYLDIYLFSNGQENSPPRKYHLVSDQLDLWRETLKELAQEQFGSPANNINLYTTQGRLIKTPLELNHNKAYVAVKSPEEFIDAGYDRYLLKATRSWEKRQDKRSTEAADTPGSHILDRSEGQASLICARCQDDLMTGKFDPESIAAIPSTLKTIVPSVVDNQASVIVKPRDRNSNSKQLDRAEKSSVKRSSISKRNETALSSAKTIKIPTPRMHVMSHKEDTTDQSSPSKYPYNGKVHRGSQKKRNSEAVLSKVEEVVNQLENSSPKNVEQINANTKDSELRSQIIGNKPVENGGNQQNKPKTIPHMFGNRPRILMTKPVENEKDQQRTRLKPFSNSIQNRNRTATNPSDSVNIELNKQKIMPNLNENQLGSKAVNLNHNAEQHFNENNQIVGDIVDNNEKTINIGTPNTYISNNNKNNPHNYNNKSPTVIPIEKNLKPRDKSDHNNKVGSSLNSPIEKNDEPLKKQEASSPPATSTMTNTLSNLSKGVINMRIEIWNSSDVTRNASCEIKAPVILLTNEIGSQVDMSGQTEHNNMLHQVIASDKDGIEGNYKVILVKGSGPNNNVYESSKHSVIGECVMFLPVIQFDELYCRCSDGNTNENHTLGTNSSAYNRIKKSGSCMSIHKENPYRISIVTDMHHEEIRPDSAVSSRNADTVQDNTASDNKFTTNNNDKQFEQSTPILRSSRQVESVRNSEAAVLQRNIESTNLTSKSEEPPKYTLDLKEDKGAKECSVSQPDHRETVDSEEPKSKQIKMIQKQPETKESVTSKNSTVLKSQAPVPSDIEKHIQTKTDESVEIINSKPDELNINAPELSSAHVKTEELSRCPSVTSASSKRKDIKETEEHTSPSNNEKLTKASAVSEATSLIETRLEPAKTQGLSQDRPISRPEDKATQTEWTDVLWEARLQEDGHYSFHLPTLSRLKEYNL